MSPGVGTGELFGSRFETDITETDEQPCPPYVYEHPMGSLASLPASRETEPQHPGPDYVHQQSLEAHESRESVGPHFVYEYPGVVDFVESEAQPHFVHEYTGVVGSLETETHESQFVHSHLAAGSLPVVGPPHELLDSTEADLAEDDEGKLKPPVKLIKPKPAKIKIESVVEARLAKKKATKKHKQRHVVLF